MAMQQGGKEAASGSGPNPALSDEDADQFAAGFTPAWDSGEGGGDDGPPADGHFAPDKTLDGGAQTLVDAVTPGTVAAALAANAAANAAAAAPAPEAPVAPPAPAPAKFNAKQTLIGTAPQANVPTGLVSPNHAAPAQPAPSTATSMPVSSTMIMNVQSVQSATNALASEQAAQSGPPVSAKAAPSSGEGRWQEKVPSRPPPGPPPAARNNANANVTADPFSVRSGAGPRPARAKSVTASDDHDLIPKKSSKTVYFIVAGLAVAAGLGLFLKFALSDDAPKPPAAPVSLGPAATTADIPPPPPKVDTPPAPTATIAAVTATAPVDTTPPTPLALPPQRTPVAAADPPPRVDTPPRSLLQPRPGRNTPPALPPPGPAAPAAPKTAPKSPNGGIVRDNPF